MKTILTLLLSICACLTSNAQIMKSHIVISHTNNTANIVPVSADTDAARGTALLTLSGSQTAGDTIELGGGTYQIASPFSINAAGVTIRGAGNATTSIKLANQAADGFYKVVTTSTWLDGVTVQDVTLNANGAAQTGTNINMGAVTLTGQNLRLERVKITGYVTTGTMGECFPATLNTTNQSGRGYVIRDCDGGTPATGKTFSDGVSIFNVFGTYNAVDPSLTGTARWARDVEISGNVVTDIQCISSGTGGKPRYCHVFTPTAVDGSVIYGNKISNMGGGLGCAVVYGDAAPTQRMIVIGNEANRVDNFLTFSPAYANTSNVQVVGNTIDLTTDANGTFAAIAVSGTGSVFASNIVVRGNLIISASNSASQGIALTKVISPVVENNTFRLVTGSNAVLITTSSNAWQFNNINADGSHAVGDVSGGSNYAAGTGLSLTGTTFSTDSATLTVNLSDTGPNNGIDAGGLTGITLPNIAGLGTGVSTALGVNVGSTGAFVLLNGAGGTPSGMTLTNATGLPVSTGISGLGTGIATFLGTPSSANLFTAITNETGTGLLVGNTNAALNGAVLTGGTINGFSIASIGSSATNSSTAFAASGTNADIVLLRALKVQETVASNNGIALTGSTLYTTGTMRGLGTAYLTDLHTGDQVGSNAAGDYGNGALAGPAIVTVVLTNTTALISRVSGTTAAYSAVEKAYRAPISVSLASGTNLFCLTTSGGISIGAIPNNFTGGGAPQIFFSMAGIAAFTGIQLNGDAMYSSGGWVPIKTFSGSPNVDIGNDSGNGNTHGQLRVGGNIVSMTAGYGLQLQSGTGQRAGNATLVGGSVTVSNTTITANTLVMLTRKTSGGTIGTAITYTLSAGSGFTITSDNILDTSTFSYLLLELN